MKHLWEYNHPYYCSDGEYHSRGADNWGQLEYPNWSAFWEEWQPARTDNDLNLLFRWDWRLPDEEDGAPGRLYLYFMLQRKGLFLPIVVCNMTPADEPQVREWLTGRGHHLLTLWEPLL